MTKEHVCKAVTDKLEERCNCKASEECDTEGSCVDCMIERTVTLLTEFGVVVDVDPSKFVCDEDCETHGGCCAHATQWVLSHM